MATNLDDLAVKLAAIRAEVETMAAAGRAVTSDERDVAMARVRGGVERIPRRTEERRGRRLKRRRRRRGAGLWLTLAPPRPFLRA